MTQADWNPESYALFTDLRLRPALDLLSRVGGLPEGQVIDLGCGPGAVGPALAARFSGHEVVGVSRRI
jgi:trans-aconitate 2-methyltransferase